jgi:hypothetical protein
MRATTRAGPYVRCPLLFDFQSKLKYVDKLNSTASNNTTNHSMILYLLQVEMAKYFLANAATSQRPVVGQLVHGLSCWIHPQIVKDDFLWNWLSSHF